MKRNATDSADSVRFTMYLKALSVSVVPSLEPAIFRFKSAAAVSFGKNAEWTDRRHSRPLHVRAKPTAQSAMPIPAIRTQAGDMICSPMRRDTDRRSDRASGLFADGEFG
jgi:hypothetical protein